MIDLTRIHRLLMWLAFIGCGVATLLGTLAWMHGLIWLYAINCGLFMILGLVAFFNYIKSRG